MKNKKIIVTPNKKYEDEIIGYAFSDSKKLKNGKYLTEVRIADISKDLELGFIARKKLQIAINGLQKIRTVEIINDCKNKIAFETLKEIENVNESAG